MQYTKYASPILLIFLLICLISPASAWLSGFDYKKEHAISYSGTDTLNNYQMRFVFYNTTGTDSGENCYLGSHINQTDWDDLRITTTSDGICDIWIQEKGINYAIVWAEIPYIYPSSDNRVFVYYGKAVATSVSDGDATFRFWGTFEQIPLNVGKWAYTGNYTQYTSEGNTLIDVIRNATSGASRVYSLDAFSYATGYELIGRIKLDMYNASYFGFLSGSKSGYFRTDTQYADSIYTQTSDVGAPTYTNLGNTYTGWRILQIQRPASGSYMRFVINGTQVANHTTDIPSTTMAAEISAQVVNANVTADWLFIKRYVNPEPQHSAWDAEVVETAPNARFDASPQWGYIPLTVYFSDTSTGPVASWSWDVDGDSVADYNTQTCSHTYTTAGYYTVELDATNTNGTSTDTKVDFINAMALPVATPQPTDNMVELIDAGAIGITGTMVTIFIYTLLFVGMIGAVFKIFG